MERFTDRTQRRASAGLARAIGLLFGLGDKRDLDTIADVAALHAHTHGLVLVLLTLLELLVLALTFLFIAALRLMLVGFWVVEHSPIGVAVHLSCVKWYSIGFWIGTVNFYTWLYFNSRVLTWYAPVYPLSEVQWTAMWNAVFTVTEATAEHNGWFSLSSAGRMLDKAHFV